jgi:hypothetical protein
VDQLVEIIKVTNGFACIQKLTIVRKIFAIEAVVQLLALPP